MPTEIIWMTGGGAYGGNTYDDFDLNSGELGITAGGGRTSTDGLTPSNARKDFTALQTVYFAAAIKMQAAGTQNLIQFNHSVDGAKIALQINTTNQTYAIVRNGTTLATSAAGVYQIGVYHHLQVGVYINDTGGWVEVRVNKVNVLRFDGDSNASGSTMRVDYIIMGGYGTYDDIVIAQTDWPGDLRVKIDRPNGAGSNTGFTPSAGANWQCVDESPANGDTDYNSSGSSGAIDTFTFPALGVSGNVAAVRVLNLVRGDVGSVNIRAQARVSGANYNGTSETANTTYTYRGTHVWNQNPATAAAWNVAGVDAAELGYGIP